jgi:hypothetical protein
MVEADFMDILKAILCQAIPAAFAVEVAHYLGGGLGIGHPEFTFCMQGRYDLMHDGRQLILVDGKYQCEVDLPGAKKRGHVLCKRKLDELFLNSGRKSLNEKILFFVKLKFFKHRLHHASKVFRDEVQN